MALYLDLAKTNINALKYSGYISVTEEVKGEIDLSMEVNKCTLDMKTCDKENNMNFRELCKKFDDKNAFFSSVLENIKPQLKCPIMPGNYTIGESFMDMSIIKYIPLDGFVWVATLRLMTGGKHKKIAMCLNTETKIIRVRSRT